VTDLSSSAEDLKPGRPGLGSGYLATRRFPKSKGKSRSSISNGQLFANNTPTDLRTSLGRRYRDLFSQMCEDAGGPENLSVGKLELIRGAATLMLSIESMSELAGAGDASFDVILFGMLLDRLGRVLDRVGLNIKRVARDITDLDGYAEF